MNILINTLTKKIILVHPKHYSFATALCILAIFMTGLLAPNNIHAINTKNQVYSIKRTPGRILVTHKQLKLHFILRNPEQIAAFYYARGFPTAMIHKLQQVCFMTVGMSNKSKEIIWLDIREWKFTDQQGPLKRYSRRYWFSEWKRMSIPLSFQSTFRWTLLPTSLDYHPGEREGGNITLQKRGNPITVLALLRPGKKKDSPPIKISIKNVKCAVNPTPEKKPLK